MVVLPAPSGPMRPKISPSRDVEVDAANGFDARRSVCVERGYARSAGISAGSHVLWRAPDVEVISAASGGQVSPVTRISPSAGMPGLAYPKPVFKLSLTPTTCFTRSSRK